MTAPEKSKFFLDECLAVIGVLHFLLALRYACLDKDQLEMFKPPLEDLEALLEIELLDESESSKLQVETRGLTRPYFERGFFHFPL